jgi:6-phosphofructokinase 2
MTIVTLTLNPAVDVSTSTERLVPEHKLRCTPERRDAGGGGINVARVLRRLGESPRAVFPVGGPNGNVLEELVAAEDVAYIAVPIHGKTRENVAVTETETGAQYRFVLPGPGLRDAEAEICCDVVRTVLQANDYLVASGSLAPGQASDFYARVGRIAQARGARFVLDASGPALKQALGAGLYLVKPSQRELSELAGRPLDTPEACAAYAARLIDEGAAKLVAVSLGSNGAILASKGCVYSAAAPRVAALSSVGAGDSFLAALVWSLSRGSAMSVALRFAVAAGSAALMSPGTGLCGAGDIVRLTNDVRVDALDVKHALPA